MSPGYLGIDRSVAYSLLGHGWRFLSGPLSIVFVASYLSPAEQGFYYTFASVLGLQVFFELGLGYVLTQFASHEKARLQWSGAGTLVGDAASKIRLASLLQRALIWYAFVAALVLIITLPAGLIFFGRHEPLLEQVNWHWPWIALVVLTALNLLDTPLMAVLEGCDLVADIALVRWVQNLAGTAVFWLLLSQGYRLAAVPAVSLVGLLCKWAWLFRTRRNFLSDLSLRSAHDQSGAMNWRRDVWPFQWRTAMMSASGYLLSLLFTPLLFAFHGAVAAAQMGMSLTICNALLAMGSAWIMTKIPRFGAHISRREWRELDAVFFPALRRSVAVVLLGGLAAIALLWYGHATGHPWTVRVLPPLPFVLIVATTIVYQIVAGQATYLRAHKREPFLVLHSVMALLTALSAYVFGQAYGATGMMAAHFTLVLALGLGAGTRVFLQKRRLWHVGVAAEE